MRELVCNGQLWASAVLRQLHSHKEGQREYFQQQFDENHGKKTTVVQYFLTEAQLFGSQDYFNPILWGQKSPPRQ